MAELPAKLRLRRQWSSEKKTVGESSAAVPEKAGETTEESPKEEPPKDESSTEEPPKEETSTEEPPKEESSTEEPPKEESPTEESPPDWETIVLEVKVPARKERIPIEMDVNDTVLLLKEKVLGQKEMYPVPVERVVLQLRKTHVELLDQQLLKDCPVFDFPHNEIDVYLKPPPPPPPDTGVLKVTLVPMNSKQEIEMEVNAEEKVAVLREKLENVHHRVRFRLPTGGRYFFVHKLCVMDETMSFREHNVRHGDIIGTLDTYLALDQKGDEDDKTQESSP